MEISYRDCAVEEDRAEMKRKNHLWLTQEIDLCNFSEFELSALLNKSVHKISPNISKELNYRQKRIIIMRRNGFTRSSIAKEFSVSVERIRQIEYKTLMILRYTRNCKMFTLLGGSEVVWIKKTE